MAYSEQIQAYLESKQQFDALADYNRESVEMDFVVYYQHWCRENGVANDLTVGQTMSITFLDGV